MNSNMASRILVVLCVIMASLMFIAQDVLAARVLAQTSGYSYIGDFPPAASYGSAPSGRRNPPRYPPSRYSHP
ncbi:hypothetical protein BRADI_1g55488v3 [Brachypodium distachyon]|uniref:Transmembrane protein n=1 Tax=Brachypodium distachyon TaxID=15368 RepID=A0A2K2DRK4_BRADI|nr:hypothetical protein BRADI_1g55488v3 [Brachypodium distachyon]